MHPTRESLDTSSLDSQAVGLNTTVVKYRRVGKTFSVTPFVWLNRIFSQNFTTFTFFLGYKVLLRCEYLTDPPSYSHFDEIFVSWVF